MAGHSQFKNIMYRKGAQDAKRAKMFTKIIREIMVAVKESGADANSNPRLRSALASAREANMPKDNIERAIKRGLGGDDTANYEEVRYEGYGPGGVAVIVETLTDNRNRTAAEVRAAFSKHSGNLGESNSVSFQFDRLGVIEYPLSVAGPDAVFEAAIDAGANDVQSGETLHEILCAPEDLMAARDALSAKFGDPASSKLAWRAKVTVPVDAETAKTLFKLIDVLEDNDDVQSVYANYDIDEEVMKNLEF
ncbi:MAG: YebC/PmpR family DNA-binding transcriptional regulator [Holosporales bacterium]